MKCPNCHSEIHDDSRFCSKCGTPIEASERASVPLAKILSNPASVIGPGKVLAGKYKILGEIGRGGMGIVYDAQDTTLGRRVAIKVLPDMFTSDPERLARFEREAKVLASLNHPIIATIHGLEEAEGKRFLVMELVEGETLAERLARGPIFFEETLDVCGQIAHGLEAAHEKSIVHRDLKPSNIKFTGEGKVKILDFGLARTYADVSALGVVADSPTITAEMTQPGVILGTAAYMSPEQAKGKAADRRADIWAFGCILFECLTGKKAFPGEAITEVMASVLMGDPDWTALPKDIPANVRIALNRCLQKDRDLRYHDIADARLEIEARAAYPSEAAPIRRRYSPLWLVAGMVVALLAGILIGPALMTHIQPAPPPLAVTSIIKVEPGHRLAGRYVTIDIERPSCPAMAISGDSRFIVYSAVEENAGPHARPQLYLRRLDQLPAKPIPGTEGAIHPFLSPDSRWVGFWGDDNKLKKVPVEGGIPTILCDSSQLWGASWDFDNKIVFSTGIIGGLSIVSADGGKLEALTKPDPKRDEVCHRLPFCLPGGNAVVFTVMRHTWDWRPWLALLRLDTREWHVLLQDAADARYVPTGHLVFLRQGTLMAVRFDLTQLKTIGEPFPAVENVSQAFSPAGAVNTGGGQFGISSSGTLIYTAGGIPPPQNDSLMWVDQRGVEQPVTDKQLPFLMPRLSPDGQRIAYNTAGREWQIWVYDLTRGTNSRLTSEGRAVIPIWAPDGKRLLFNWLESVKPNLFWQPSDGSSPMERMTTSESSQWPGSWSLDGKTVALVESHPGTTGFDIAMLDVNSRRVTPFLNSRFNETYPDFSPDGRWIAYTSDESTRDEVYVRPYPGPGMKYQISSEGGGSPLWARNSQQLFYRSENQVWAVDVRTDAGFTYGKPRLLFDKPGYSIGDPIRGFDLSFDSQRFLMVKFDQRKPRPITEMILVQNWFEELKRLVPGGKT